MKEHYLSRSTRRLTLAALLASGCGPFVEIGRDEDLIQRKCNAVCSRLEECSLNGRGHRECVSGCAESPGWDGCVEIRAEFLDCLEGSTCEDLESRGDAVLSNERLEDEVCFEESLEATICR